MNCHKLFLVITHEHISHLEKPSILDPQSVTMRYILVSQSEKKTTKVYHEDEAKKHKQKA
jgi:hypothetical protein